MPEKSKLRLDKYLWAIRIFKTRTLASDACLAGKVKFNSASTKPAKTVNIGDKYDIKTEDKKWQIEVTGLLHSRVQYAEAIKYYVDHSHEPDKEKVHDSAFVFNTGKRQSKQGRPTKKQKRELDDFMTE